MIRFLKNSTNNVVVTLTENSTVTNPIYLFLFTNQTSNVPYYFIGTDTSAYKTRYNKFSIVVNTYFTNSLNGMYVYEVYEQMSTSNLNITGLNMLESGIMMLDTPTTIFTEYTTTDTYKIRQ